MGHKGTSKEQVQVQEKVKPLSENGLDTKLLFDNARRHCQNVVKQDGLFSTIIMGKGKTANNYSLEEISAIKESRPPYAFVQIVNAECDLRRKVVFWRQYPPRLTGLKEHGDNADDEE